MCFLTPKKTSVLFSSLIFISFHIRSKGEHHWSIIQVEAAKICPRKFSNTGGIFDIFKRLSSTVSKSPITCLSFLRTDRWIIACPQLLVFKTDELTSVYFLYIFLIPLLNRPIQDVTGTDIEDGNMGFWIVSDRNKTHIDFNCFFKSWFTKVTVSIIGFSGTFDLIPRNSLNEISIIQYQQKHY